MAGNLLSLASSSLAAIHGGGLLQELLLISLLLSLGWAAARLAGLWGVAHQLGPVRAFISPPKLGVLKEVV